MTAQSGEGTLELFREKFRLNSLTICQTLHWVWSLRPAQLTLGSSVLSLKRHAARFGEVSAAESEDLHNAVALLEATCRRIWEPDRFNYLMLMMVDEHVHFHVVPRYSRPRLLASREWVDDAYPSLPVLAASPTDEATLAGIRALLQSAAAAPA